MRKLVIFILLCAGPSWVLADYRNYFVYGMSALDNGEKTDYANYVSFTHHFDVVSRGDHPLEFENFFERQSNISVLSAGEIQTHSNLYGFQYQGLSRTSPYFVSVTALTQRRSGDIPGNDQINQYTLGSGFYLGANSRFSLDFSKRYFTRQNDSRRFRNDDRDFALTDTTFIHLGDQKALALTARAMTHDFSIANNIAAVGFDALYFPNNRLSYGIGVNAAGPRPKKFQEEYTVSLRAELSRLWSLGAAYQFSADDTPQMQIFSVTAGFRY